MATNKNFRDWPSKHVVVTGTGESEITYICYSPFPACQVADAHWLVEKINASGGNFFPTASISADGELIPNQAASDPASLTYLARS